MPDTASYLILGLVVVVGIFAFYAFSLWLRLRNVERDLQVLDDLSN